MYNIKLSLKRSLFQWMFNSKDEKKKTCICWTFHYSQTDLTQIYKIKLKEALTATVTPPTQKNWSRLEHAHRARLCVRACMRVYLYIERGAYLLKACALSLIFCGLIKLIHRLLASEYNDRR